MTTSRSLPRRARASAIALRRPALAGPAFLLAAGVLAAAALLAPRAARASDDDLYRSLGGQAGIQRLAHDFVPRLAGDDRLRPFFEKTDLAHLEESLAAQICEVSGGPCTYEGPSMAVAHQDLEIRTKDFNALVEVLQRTLDDEGVPFAVQNRLLARLAPMHRDIVNTR